MALKPNVSDIAYHKPPPGAEGEQLFTALLR
jgi:hypothetical protein